MKFEFMKQIRACETAEALKKVMAEVLTMHARCELTDETFGKIYDVFEAKREELR